MNTRIRYTSVKKKNEIYKLICCRIRLPHCKQFSEGNKNHNQYPKNSFMFPWPWSPKQFFPPQIFFFKGKISIRRQYIWCGLTFYSSSYMALKGHIFYGIDKVAQGERGQWVFYSTSPQSFYNNVFLFVDLTTLGTFDH